MRINLIKNINSYFSRINYLNNTSFLLNVRILYFTDLSQLEQNKITKNLIDNLEKILKVKNACEMLEEVILSYPKGIVHSLKISLIKNAMNIVRTSNGMFALIKTILSESLKYQNIFKTNNTQSLTSLSPFITNDSIPDFHNKSFFSEEELNEISLRKNIYESLINEVIINFTSFIVIRNGSVVINHLLSSLLIQPEISDLLMNFLENLSIEEVLEVSCYKYSNKIVENLLSFPIFNKRICQYFYLEKENLLDIQNSALFFLCSKFRGINILDKVLEKAEFYDALRLFKDLQKISKCEFLQDKHFSHLNEILARKKAKIFDNKNKNLEKFSKQEKQVRVLHEKIRLIKANKDNLITTKNNILNIKQKKNNTDKIKYRISTNKDFKEGTQSKKCSSNPSIKPFNDNSNNKNFQLETPLNSIRKNESTQGFINNNFIHNIQNNFSFMYPINSSSINNNTHNNYISNNFNNYNSASNNNINSYQQVYNLTQPPLNYNKLHYNTNSLNNNNFNNKNFINNNTYNYNNNIDLQSISNPYEDKYIYNYAIENNNINSKSNAYNSNFDFDCNVNYNIVNKMNNNNIFKNYDSYNNCNSKFQNNNYINSPNFTQNINNQYSIQSSISLPQSQKNIFVNKYNYTDQIYAPNNSLKRSQIEINNNFNNNNNNYSNNKAQNYQNVYNSTMTVRRNNNLKFESNTKAIKVNNTASTQNVVTSQKQSLKSMNKEKESFCNQVFPEGIFNIHTEDDTLNIDNVNKKTK